MDAIETITTSEAASLLGVSERTLRRWIRRHDIQPVVVSDGPGIQNRYDRALILNLAKTPVTETVESTDTGRDSAPILDNAQIRADMMLVRNDIVSQVTAVRGDVQRDMTTILDRLSQIEEALSRLEASAPPPKRGFWGRLFGR